MKTKKTVFRYFTINDDTMEEKWLREMAKQGWVLEQVYFPGFYRFKMVEPIDIIYRLDYHPFHGSTNEGYITMYGDYGWNHVTSLMGYHYFSKPTSECAGEETIFSDSTSKRDMITRLIHGRLIPLVITIVLLILFSWLSTLWHGLTIGDAIGLTIAFLLGLILVTVFFFYQYIRVNR